MIVMAVRTDDRDHSPNVKAALCGYDSGRLCTWQFVLTPYPLPLLPLPLVLLELAPTLDEIVVEDWAVAPLAPQPAEYRLVTLPSRLGIRVSSEARVGSTPETFGFALLRVLMRDVVVLILLM